MTLLPRLSDDALEAELKRLAAAEREAQAAQLPLLAEFDVRGLPEASGRSTLYEYCLKDLGLAESAAYDRVQAARACARWPRVAEEFRVGRLSLSALAILAPLLNEHTAVELLAEAVGLGRREAEDLAAEVAPLSDRKERERIEPLSAERVRFAFTGSAQLRRDIDRARELLWHKDPSGRLETVLGALVEFYLGRKDPDRRLGLAARAPEPGAARDGGGRAGGPGPEERLAAARSRLIPQAVKDEVWLRDGGRCAFTSKEGRRCEARAGLEYDHIVPWVFGGRSDTALNIRLLCRAHNQRAAREAGLGRRTQP